MTIDQLPTPPAMQVAADTQSGSKVIGRAVMQPDGTITMELRLEDPATGAVGHAYPRYAPADPRYKFVLDRLGPFQPGESRPVREDWED